jgi:hypothetical protein
VRLRLVTPTLLFEKLFSSYLAGILSLSFFHLKRETDPVIEVWGFINLKQSTKSKGLVTAVTNLL